MYTTREQIEECEKMGIDWRGANFRAAIENLKRAHVDYLRKNWKDALAFWVPMLAFILIMAFAFGCGPTYHEQSMQEVREMHCPDLLRLVDEAQELNIELSPQEKAEVGFCREQL